MKTLLSFGHGYSAQALSKILPSEQWQIIGTTRSPEKRDRLAAEGISAVLWPGTDLRPHLAKSTHLLISAGPDTAGDPVLNSLRDALEQYAAQFKWVGYLSTTGVYGDHQGAWVDEKTPLTPSTKRGQLRVRAETAWQDLARETGLPLHIFRLAGIYGPGRGPFKKLRDGTARRIVKEGQIFSRIHVDDIAQILAASLQKPDPVAIYNLCDDDPAPPQDVIGFAAELLGLPLPPEVAFEQADLSPMARSFYAESKRVRNARIKTDLGIQLKYPSYKIGLKDLLQQEE